jgi:hypothetical protein
MDSLNRKFKITTQFGTIEPDFILKDIAREERANLPPDFKVFFFLVQKNKPIEKWMLDDCQKRFPEYFVKNPKIYAV